MELLDLTLGLCCISNLSAYELQAPDSAESNARRCCYFNELNGKKSSKLPTSSDCGHQLSPGDKLQTQSVLHGAAADLLIVPVQVLCSSSAAPPHNLLRCRLVCTRLRHGHHQPRPMSAVG